MSNWTQADIDAIKAKQQKASTPAKPSKHRNVKTWCDGFRFDSKKEADYWLLLKTRQELGEITELQRQVRFPLCCPDSARTPGQYSIVADYVADYVFMENGVQHVVDAKGQKKRACPYPLKKKWLELQTGIVIEEV